MLHWITPIVAAVVILTAVAISRGWTTLPSMGGFTLAIPAWATAWWAAHWALLVIFLPLLVITVFFILPALPIGYEAYAAHGGATGWLLILLLLFLAIVLTIPQKWLRTSAAVVLAMLLFWVVVPAALWTVMGYCTPTDTACKYEQAAKEEAQQQRQVAAQRAVEASRQPATPQCNVHRAEYRFEATKPDYKFNPGGVCSPQLFIEGHCVYVTQHRSEETLGPICSRGDGVPRDKQGNRVAMPVDIDRAWSADGSAFVAEIGLWAPRYEKLLSWR